MSQEAIERFLWEEMGYRKIEELLTGKKDRKTDIRKFLEGTIFATFKPFVYKGQRMKMPEVPRIKPVEEAKGTATILKDEKELRSFVLSLPYFIETYSMFRGYGPKKIKPYLQDLSRRLFSDAGLSFTANRHFGQTELTGRIISEDFYLGAVASWHRDFEVYFKTNPDLVEAINGVQEKYQEMLEHTKEDALNWREGQDYTNIGTSDLASMIGQVPNEELVKLLRQAERLPYQPGSSYTEGQSIDHQRFGVGIVESVQGSRMNVYFPELGASKTLIHNYRS